MPWCYLEGGSKVNLAANHLPDPPKASICPRGTITLNFFSSYISTRIKTTSSSTSVTTEQYSLFFTSTLAGQPYPPVSPSSGKPHHLLVVITSATLPWPQICLMACL